MLDSQDTETTLIDPNIITYLDDNYVDEMRDLLLQGMMLIYGFYDNFDDTMIQNIVDKDDEFTGKDLELRELIENNLRMVIKSHYIITAQDLNLSQIVSICSALYKAQFIEDYSYFIQVFDRPETTNREKLSALLSIADDRPEHYFDELIDFIYDDALFAFKNLADRHEVLHKTPSSSGAIGDLVKKLTDMSNNNILLTFYQCGMEVGKPFEFYCKLFDLYITDYVKKEEHEPLVYFVYTLVVFSDVEKERYSETLLKFFNTVTHDPLLRNQYMLTLRSLQMSLTEVIDG